jgi:two-component system CheB/CheR fusion protein
MRNRGAAGPSAQRALEIAERQVEHQTRLVDDLLDVSRIETGKIRLRVKPLNLVDVVRRVASAIEWQAAERGQTLGVETAEAALLVEGDPDRLEQVVWNLLSNSIKYTPRGGNISVAVTRVPSGTADDEAALLRVVDDGIGLTPDEAESIFNLYSQAGPAAERVRGGLGIGLTLVEQIIHLHGGTVHASSAGRGRGTEFSVRLPLLVGTPPAEAGASSEPALSRVSDGLASLPVVIIEDNADAREMLVELLDLSGFSVEAAATGEQGLSLVRTCHPRLVLVDLDLPGINGFEVARQIRDAKHEPEPMLVALTGHGQPEDYERARAAGFDEHLLKPFDPDRLRDLLRTHLDSTGPAAARTRS